MTTTWRPFGRVKSVILGAPAATGVMAPAAFATRASAASVVRVLRKALVLPNDDARIVAGGLAKAPSRGEGGAQPRRCAAASQPPSASIARRAVFDSHRFGLLILRADPVGLVRRRRLIARRRRRQVFPHRFAVELAGLPLVAERRKNVLEEALAAELGGPHRPSRFFGRGRSADRPGGLAFVELVARQRTAFRLHGLGGGPGGLFLLGCGCLALHDVGILGPGRVGADRSLALRQRQIAARRHDQWRALTVIDAFAVLAQADVLHQLAKELGVERHLFLVVGGERSAGAQRHGHGQCNGCHGSGAPLPLPILVPHKLSPSTNGGMCRIPGCNCAQDQGAFTAPRSIRVSYRRPTTPATMATSARLNTYHLKLKLAVVRWNSTKSATAP